MALSVKGAPQATTTPLSLVAALAMAFVTMLLGRPAAAEPASQTSVGALTIIASPELRGVADRLCELTRQSGPRFGFKIKITAAADFVDALATARKMATRPLDDKEVDEASDLRLAEEAAKRSQDCSPDELEATTSPAPTVLFMQKDGDQLQITWVASPEKALSKSGANPSRHVRVSVPLPARGAQASRAYDLAVARLFGWRFLSVEDTSPFAATVEFVPSKERCSLTETSCVPLGHPASARLHLKTTPWASPRSVRWRSYLRCSVTSGAQPPEVPGTATGAFGAAGDGYVDGDETTNVALPLHWPQVNRFGHCKVEVDAEGPFAKGKAHGEATFSVLLPGLLIGGHVGAQTPGHENYRYYGERLTLRESATLLGVWGHETNHRALEAWVSGLSSIKGTVVVAAGQVFLQKLHHPGDLWSQSPQSLRKFVRQTLDELEAARGDLVGYDLFSLPELQRIGIALPLLLDLEIPRDETSFCREFERRLKQWKAGGLVSNLPSRWAGRCRELASDMHERALSLGEKGLDRVLIVPLDESPRRAITYLEDGAAGKVFRLRDLRFASALTEPFRRHERYRIYAVLEDDVLSESAEWTIDLVGAQLDVSAGAGVGYESYHGYGYSRRGLIFPDSGGNRSGPVANLRTSVGLWQNTVTVRGVYTWSVEQKLEDWQGNRRDASVAGWTVLADVNFWCLPSKSQKNEMWEPTFLGMRFERMDRTPCPWNPINASMRFGAGYDFRNQMPVITASIDGHVKLGALVALRLGVGATAGTNFRFNSSDTSAAVQPNAFAELLFLDRTYLF